MARWCRVATDSPKGATRGFLTSPARSGRWAWLADSPFAQHDSDSDLPEVMRPYTGSPLRRTGLVVIGMWLAAGLLVVATSSGAGDAMHDHRQVFLTAVKQKPKDCHGQPAERLACEAGMTLEQFCQETWNSQMVGCSSNPMSSSLGNTTLGVATAPQTAGAVTRRSLTSSTTAIATSITTHTTQTSMATVTITTTVNASSITATMADNNGCCKHHAARCLACKFRLSVSEFCMRGFHKGIAGCGSACTHVEENMGYRGGDLWSKTNVSSAEACCKLCRTVRECTSWTWGKQGNLKSSGVCFLKDQVELIRVVNPNFVSGLPYSPTTSFEDNLGYHGGDLWSKKDVKTAVSCCWLCKTVPKCASWTWGKPGNNTSSNVCFLKKRVDLKRVANPHFMSGSPRMMPSLFEIKSRHGTCLSAGNGKLRLAPCRAAFDSNQVWMYDFWTGHVVMHDTTCVDAPEDFVSLKPCSQASDSQRLVHYGGKNGLIYGNGFCLRASSLTEPDAAVSMWTCDTSAVDQQWSMFSVWHLGGKTVKQAVEHEMQATPAPLVAVDATQNVLFCFTAVQPTTEQERILKQQLKMQTGIFACDAFSVYSTRAFSMGNVTVTTVNVNMQQGGDESLYRAPVSASVWGEVIQSSKFRNHDWTVKVDPYAAFLPWRLRTVVKFFDESQTQTGHGVYLQNCNTHLELAIEVLSRRAMQTYAIKCLGPQLSPAADPTGRRLLRHEDGWLKSVLVDLHVAALPTSKLLPMSSCTASMEFDASKCRPGFVAFYPLKTAQAYSDCLGNATER